MNATSDGGHPIGSKALQWLLPLGVGIVAALPMLIMASQPDLTAQYFGTKAVALAVAGGAFCCGALLMLLWLTLRNGRAKVQRVLDRAAAQMEAVLLTARDVVLLLDRDCMIVYGTERAARSLLGVPKIRGCQAASVLRTIADQKVMGEFREFLYQRARGDRSLAANPLREFSLAIDDDEGDAEIRHFEMSVVDSLPVESGAAIALVISDVSQRKALNDHVGRLQDERGRQREILADIVRIDRDALLDFLATADSHFASVNAALRKVQPAAAGSTAHLADIFRSIAPVQEAAAKLDMGSFAGPISQFLAALEAIRKRSTVAGRELLPLTVLLKDLFERAREVRELLDALGQREDTTTALSSTDAAPAATAESDESGELTALARGVAEKLGVQVVVSRIGIPTENIPRRYRFLVRELTRQLVRDAVIHGIEAPEIRNRMRKASLGEIAVSVANLGAAGWEIVVRDDGAGIDPKAIAKQLIDQGASAEKVASLDSAALLQMVFRRGFSSPTKERTDVAPGIGLDVIRDMVHQAGGRIKLRSVPGQFTQFQITLPSVSLTNNL